MSERQYPTSQSPEARTLIADFVFASPPDSTREAAYERATNTDARFSRAVPRGARVHSRQVGLLALHGRASWYSPSPGVGQLARAFTSRGRKGAQEVLAKANLVFPLGEYRSRLEAVQGAIHERSLGGLVVLSPHNVYWLSGFRTAAYFAPLAVVVPGSGDPVLITQDEEEESIHNTSWVEDYAVYDLLGDWSERSRAIAGAITRLGIRGSTVGVEQRSSYFTVLDYLALSQQLSDTTVVDASDVVHNLRLIKSPREVAYIAEAARICEVGMTAVAEAARPGAHEREVVGRAYERMIAAGSDYHGPVYINSRSGNAAAHEGWTDRQLGDDDRYLHAQLAASRHSYTTTLVRPVWLRSPSTECAAALAGAESALAAAEAVVKPGMSGDRIAGILKEGFAKGRSVAPAFEMLGYSIGISFPPGMGEWYLFSVHTGNRAVLRESMTIHLIPMANVEDLGTVGCSRSYLVTDAGLKPLEQTDTREGAP